MKNLFYIVILSFLTVYCSSTRQLQSPNRLTASSDFQSAFNDSLSTADKRYVRSEYILGITLFELGEYQKSLKHLNNAYLKDPNKSGINYALADNYLKLDDLVNAEYYGKQAVNLEPNNKWYHLKLATVYSKSGDIEGQIQELRTVLKQSPNDVQVMYQLAGALSADNKMKESNQIYNHILSISGSDPYIHYQKYKNFESMGMRDSVITELEAIQKLQPDNPSTLQSLTNYYLQDHKITKAKHLLRDVIQRNPGRNEPIILLSNVFIKINEPDSVAKLIRPIIQNTTVHSDRKEELVHYTLSKYSSRPHNQKIRDLTHDIVTDFTAADPQNPHSHTLAASFYINEQQTTKAISELEKSTALDPDNDTVWVELVRLTYNTGNHEAALAKAVEANQHVSDNAFIQFVIGSSYYSMQQLHQAAHWLKKASQLPAQHHFKSIICGLLGDTYSAIDQWASADSAYNAALHADSTNATVLNNYAYYLSKRNEKLEKAKKMALKALETDPENDSFLDTLGWIYFKLGRYDKAEDYLQQALDNKSASAEVMEHMGDVYQKQGKMEEAKKWWKKALNKDPKRAYLKNKIETEK